MLDSTRNKLLGLIGLFGAAFVGGGILPSLIRTGANAIDPFIFTWSRAVVGTLLLLPFYLQKHSLSELYKRERLPLVFILGLGVGLNITLFAFGVQHTTLIASQLMYTLVPIVVSFLAFWLVGEKLNTRKAAGIVLSLLGIFILLFFSRSPTERLSLGSFYGNMLIFIAMFGYSIYIAFSKKFTKTISILELVTTTNAALSIFLLPLASYGLYQHGFQGFSLNISIVIFLTGVSSLILFWLAQLSIKHLSASTASLSTLIGPEFAAVVGIVWYREKISALLALSLLLTISGVLLSTSGESKGLLAKIFNRFRIK